MTTARAALLERIIGEVALNGLADRSLRDIAVATGTSHRMVLYHFGDRAGLVSAIVGAVESDQRETLVRMAATAESAEELILALWHHVCSEELRPFVRLFFECVGLTGGVGLTDPWLDVADRVTEMIGSDFDADRIRLGVAVTRGLLIDVLATGSSDAATRSLETFVEMWRASE
ncbi:MAG: TetR/AcrR family transcriptional regulator [Acidimicrobiia bacterium]|nr:TetR/AcrR family transcriptional regulator [Acidimicrobiia bacterium]